ncbi:hypothetical protein [Pseudoduganella violaceinigra]|uniref:hypothetical protein n=1 Tax=Pseudoduganella violaceinigra TaxID=246602 RepID=UPI0012B5D0BA|nr:hypothetical protein [Pseudoduganella violaceinigra]
MHWYRFGLTCVLAASAPAWAAPPPTGPDESMPVVKVDGLADPDDQSYRRMVKGMDAFEKYRHLAPNASLRYRLYPRIQGVKLSGIQVAIQSESGMQPVPLEKDLTFTLPRDAKALEDGARVVVNRKSRSFAWGPEVRTPGLPPNTRRLGDLRLECQIDRAATLLVGFKPPAYLVLDALVDVCTTYPGAWLYYGERAVFNVTLVDGARRQALFSKFMYGNMLLKPFHLFYDFYPVLTERTYNINISDQSWSDDTLVELEYMEDEPVRATL